VGEAPNHVVDPDYDTSTEPLKLVNNMSAADFFAYAANLLAVNPPHSTDFSQLARIANMGIVAGEPFDASRFSTEQLAEIDAGRAAALQNGEAEGGLDAAVADRRLVPVGEPARDLRRRPGG
jgi:hypothetical protein